MSWSLEVTGTKTAVRAVCEAEFRKQASNYAGKEEEKDVLAAKERVLACLDGPPAGYGNGIRIMANGSRSDGYLTMNVSVMACSIALDPPAPEAEQPKAAPAPAEPPSGATAP